MKIQGGNMDKLNIVVLDSKTLGENLDWSIFKDLGNLTLYDLSTKEEAKKRVKNADIILTNKVNIDEELLDSGKNIKYIGVLATGYNIVDLEECTKRDIVITNIPNYGTDTVAQFTFALLLKIANEVDYHNRLVKNGEWGKRDIFSFWDSPQIELKDKTIGIIGYGKIGQKVGEIAKAFGMNILSYRGEGKVKKYSSDVSLDYLLKNSDIISLHANLTEENKFIINEKSIDKMEKKPIIINVARGGLIDEFALTEALNSGKIRAAGLDVLNTEPIKDNNPLLKAKNITLTPHMAWTTFEARDRIMSIAYENIVDFINKDNKNRVN